MSPKVALVPLGPDRWCPTCGRALFTLHDDGTFDLAGKAMIETRVELEVPGGDVPEDGKMFVVNAICMRRRCRLKRWIDRAEE